MNKPTTTTTLYIVVGITLYDACDDDDDMCSCKIM